MADSNEHGKFEGITKDKIAELRSIRATRTPRPSWDEAVTEVSAYAGPGANAVIKGLVEADAEGRTLMSEWGGATIFEALGVPRDLHWQELRGRPHPVYSAEPIPGLL